jgi:hypothetical protein
MAKRFYAPFTEWEDFKNGMFGKEVKTDQVEASKILLSDSDALLLFMQQVCAEWHISAKHNLTNAGSNRRSWLGQAACCLSHKATEFETRLAWKELSKEQQFSANRSADIAISEWESANNFNKKDYVKEAFTL